MPSEILYRTAHLNEATQIADLINRFAGREDMLPRTSDNVIESIRNFIVAVSEEKIVGCAALAFFTKDLAEIRSVAVDESFQGRGVGKALIQKAESILKEEVVGEVFVLTRTPGFFKRVGYDKVDKDRFPQKIWRDCMNCPRLMNCDEVAMTKKIT